MINKPRIISSLLGGMALVLSTMLYAQYLDPNINYFTKGRVVSPWELSLQFGQVKLDGNSGKTARGSLIIEPATRTSENDVVVIGNVKLTH